MRPNIPSLCLVDLLLFFVLFPMIWGNYYIDDESSTVQYINGGSRWYHLNITTAFTSPPLDSSKIYNNTFSAAHCFTSDGCSMIIPFTGSGITVRGLIWSTSCNYIVSIDGQMAPPPPTLPLWTLETPNAPIYNVTLYDIQSLPLTYHTLNVSILSPASGIDPSDFHFDYAYVNEMGHALSPPSVPSHSHFPVGAVAGGILGALAAVTVAVFTLVYFRNKRRVLIPAEIDPEPNRMPFSSSDAEWHLPHVSQPSTMYPSFTLDATSPMHPKGSSSITSPQNIQTTSPSNADLLVLSDRPTSVVDQRLSTSLPTTLPGSGVAVPHDPASPSASQLTDEQADFVNSLYNLNIPAPTIAHVMQRMTAGQAVRDIQNEMISMAGLGRSSVVTRGNTMTSVIPPPSYSE